MKLLRCVMLLAGLLLAPCIAMAGNVEMIFWENQDWESGGNAERMTLWSDGGSEVSKTQHFAPSESEQLKPGWKTRGDDSNRIYYFLNPLPKAEAKRRFAAALANGMQSLKTSAAGYYDGSGTLIGIKTDGKIRETTIPLFILPGVKDNAGSENQRRYMRVKAVFGDFHVDPFMLAIAPNKISVVTLHHFMPSQKRTEHFVLDNHGSNTVSVNMACIAPEKVEDGWNAGGTGNNCTYSQNHILPPSDAIKRFNDVVAAGIASVEPTPAQTQNKDTVTLIMRTDTWQEKTVSISTDTAKNQPDNFKHFLAVQKAFGHFDTRVEKAAP